MYTTAYIQLYIHKCSVSHAVQWCVRFLTSGTPWDRGMRADRYSLRRSRKPNCLCRSFSSIFFHPLFSPHRTQLLRWFSSCVHSSETRKIYVFLIYVRTPHVHVGKRTSYIFLSPSPYNCLFTSSLLRPLVFSFTNHDYRIHTLFTMFFLSLFRLCHSQAAWAKIIYFRVLIFNFFSPPRKPLLYEIMRVRQRNVGFWQAAVSFRARTRGAWFKIKFWECSGNTGQLRKVSCLVAQIA